ncbi:MAG TPA: AMP-binding protein, partial [Burkholderiales bacterium]|nr:AMP-binding protein [Burkholderiales bacterium]
MPDRYDELYKSFRWHVPERYNIAQACCGQWAEDRSRFALYWEDESGASAAYSFWDVQVAANRLSNALAALGVERGDRVALLLPQRPETAISYVGIFQMGAIAVPLSHLFGPDALEYRLRDAGVC